MYAVYGWAATQSRYAIDFWDYLTKTTAVITTGQQQNQYAYNASDEQPGLLLVYPLVSGTRMRPYVFPINNAPSLATLRWMVRDTLNDTETEDGVDVKYPESPKWTDRELNAYLQEAINYYSNFDSAEYIIDTDTSLVTPTMFRSVKEVIDVSYYDNVSKEWRLLQQSSRHGERGNHKSWEMSSGNLKLYGAFQDPTLLQIRVLVPYRVPVSDLQELTVPYDDWDILSLYAQAKAYIRLAGQSAQLDRFKEEGKRNDNPVTPIARMLMQQAESRLKDRRGPRVIRRVRG